MWREGRWYIAQDPVTAVASQGRTKSQALKNLTEALKLHRDHSRADK